MYLSALEQINDSVSKFLQHNAKTYKLLCQGPPSNLSMFYMNLQLLSKEVSTSITNIKSPKELKHNSQDQSSHPLQGQLGRLCTSQDLVKTNNGFLPNSQFSSKISKSYSKTQRTPQHQIFKYKNHKSWLLTTYFEQLMQNLASITTYQNKTQYFHQQLINNNNTITTTLNTENILQNQQIIFKESNSTIEAIQQDLYQIQQQINGIIIKCKQTYNYLMELKETQSKKDRLSTDTTSKSLLTEIITKKQGSKLLKAMHGANLQQSCQFPRKKLVRTFQVKSGIQKLIVNEFDLENYKVGENKQKKINVNQGQCSKCTIF